MRKVRGWVDVVQLDEVEDRMERGDPGGWHLPLYSEKQPHMRMALVDVVVIKVEERR